MTQGILLYAHNNRTVDYALMAVIAGGLAKKNLKVPVSLITDASTIAWMKESNIFDQAEGLFDHIITVDRPTTDNQRRLHDGQTGQMIPFINTNRSTAWELTPYDRTLLIDSDFFILSDSLGEYWNVDADVMLGSAINDIYDDSRVGYLDRHVSDTGVKMYWATTVMFSKNANSKLFFDTVNYVKENYSQFADVFRFDSRQFRNDIAFSVAKHILDGYQQTGIGALPPVLSALDKDILHSVNGNTLTFLVDYKLINSYCAAAISNIDIHIMNKQSVIRNKQALLELI
jgi:hypothetical protein